MKAKKSTFHVPFTKRASYESNILFGLSAALLAGIFYSTAVTSVCLIGIVILSLRHITFQKVKTFLGDYRMMPFMLVFLSVFLSGSYTEDQEAFLTALRVKLPFLILPFSIYVLPSIRAEWVIHLHYWLLFLATIVGFPVLVYALNHYDEMIQLLSKGQPIPTPIEHVKYSMINAYCAMAGIILFFQNSKNVHKIYRWLNITSVAFLIALIHVLAVRTGLVILYMSVILYCAYHVINYGSSRMLLVISVSIMLLPVITYNTVPSLRQKIDYMRYDWSKFKNDDGHNYSDSERIMSYQAGWNIWKSNSVLGVGYGDIRNEAHLFYDKYYDRPNLYKLPHSQFLLILAGGGLLGFITFISGFYTPLLRSELNSTTGLLLASLYLNYTLSFLVENSLERSMSVANFVILALLLIKVQHGEVNRGTQLSLPEES